ncbi:hypothetical protein [Spirillospora sp. NPDC048819]|uniref:hypothetical protein n=1 Tax=Spirillospora sp. NPDC048819 TaxID=3155268 RepID=UPI003406486F
MSNSTRWTLVGILVALNVLSNTVMPDTWIGIALSVVFGVAAIAIVADFVLRRRREQ